MSIDKINGLLGAKKCKPIVMFAMFQILFTFEILSHAYMPKVLSLFYKHIVLKTNITYFCHPQESNEAHWLFMSWSAQLTNNHDHFYESL